MSPWLDSEHWRRYDQDMKGALTKRACLDCRAVISRQTLVVLAAMLLATPANSQGPKVVEIDEHGNVRQSSSPVRTIENEKKAKASKTPKTARQRKFGSVCDPGYTWSSEGVSPDLVARTRAFYRDVTRPYERDQIRARQSGKKVSRERDLEFWNAFKRFKDSVPQEQREIVDWGIEPRLSWWCNAPPVIRSGPAPRPPSPPSVPTVVPPISKGQ